MPWGATLVFHMSGNVSQPDFATMVLYKVRTRKFICGSHAFGRFEAVEERNSISNMMSMLVGMGQHAFFFPNLIDIVILKLLQFNCTAYCDVVFPP